MAQLALSKADLAITLLVLGLATVGSAAAQDSGVPLGPPSDVPSDAPDGQVGQLPSSKPPNVVIILTDDQVSNTGQWGWVCVRLGASVVSRRKRANGTLTTHGRQGPHANQLSCAAQRSGDTWQHPPRGTGACLQGASHKLAGQQECDQVEDTFSEHPVHKAQTFMSWCEQVLAAARTARRCGFKQPLRLFSPDTDREHYKCAKLSLGPDCT